MRIRETDIISKFQSLQAQYAPLLVRSVGREVAVAGNARADAIIEFEIEGGPSFRALVEITALGSPKSIREKCVQVLDLVRRAEDATLVPLVIAPYVCAKQAAALREAGVSWMDLSGNMVLRVPNRLYIERTGQPNQFPDTASIKKVFEGTTSLVARALLLQPAGFASLAEIVDFIKSRNADITIATVSKALRVLEEELLVSRAESRISVMDGGRLLDRLAEGYRSYVRRRVLTSVRFAVNDVERTLGDLCSSLMPVYILCGFYAAQLKGLAATDRIAMYVQDMDRVRQAAQRLSPDILPDDEFGQLTVMETRDHMPWFNAQIVNGLSVVDDVELYLEMTVDTPRGPKVADMLRPQILRGRDHG